MIAETNIRNLNIKISRNIMHIRRRKGTQKLSPMPTRSKAERERKGEKCTYFHKGFHSESACMKKKIYLMS
jgi:hypothetical protein